MLSAERIALNSDLQARRLDIREKDLIQLTTFIDGLSTQAALLAGFAFSGLQSLPPETNAVWKTILFVSTAVTLGADIYVVCVGQLTTILAPTLALNGPKGSMERAVCGMRAERGYVFQVGVAWGFAIAPCSPLCSTLLCPLSLTNPRPDCAWQMFLLGLVGFFFEVVALLAIYLDVALAATCIVIVCLFFVATVIVSTRVVKNFQVSYHT